MDRRLPWRHLGPHSGFVPPTPGLREDPRCSRFAGGRQAVRRHPLLTLCTGLIVVRCQTADGPRLGWYDTRRRSSGTISRFRPGVIDTGRHLGWRVLTGPSPGALGRRRDRTHRSAGSDRCRPGPDLAAFREAPPTGSGPAGSAPRSGGGKHLDRVVPSRLHLGADLGDGGTRPRDRRPNTMHRSRHN